MIPFRQERCHRFAKIHERHIKEEIPNQYKGGIQDAGRSEGVRRDAEPFYLQRRCAA